ncbi:putative sphingomyelin phosphodiesterase [Coleophoma crateriformis]|uniref:Putative sphingomyelin phosphodiesterase n=1 Tax=Coleophoma crateriformis TaxID=565419 RepID=A0A3D8SI87_9HELO|nr:putative sphingomyelin phosphodiesterase [Coleophoma crateriformis]
MAKILAVAALLCSAISSVQADIPGAASYTVSSAFPTSVFSSYYVKPEATAEPQPVIYDPILNTSFPLNLTDPKTIPTADNDPVYYPQAVANLTNATSEALVQVALSEIKSIISGEGGLSGNCSKCIAALSVGKFLAQTAPSYVPDAMISLCQSTGFTTNASCVTSYAAGSYGAIWTQILALADVNGLDGRYICSSLSTTFCSAPSTSPLNTTGLFPKPKPANATAPKPSGERVKVLHLSDFHLDPRYSFASEANCSSGMCCRYSSAMTSQAVFPAPIYGAYKCDTPYYLGLSALQSIGAMTGTGSGQSSPAWTIYTGDLMSHDSQNQLSRAYTEYIQVSVYEMFKSYIGGPVYSVLGNHDSSPEAIDGPHSMPGPLGQQFSWNYDHVSSLWQNNGWFNASEAKEASIHYAAYSVKNEYGLRIITMNTDFWYKSNYLNYINSSDPDVSGTFKFMIEELQAAEDAGERVWILGHVLSGWDGTNPLANPTDLFYQIVDRYSPHVIANVFFGHTHEDQVMIYYANNGTVQNASTALAAGWIGPSVTPLTNLNSGYRMYEVDTGTFDIYEAYTFYSDVSTFSDLNGTGPVFQFEYSTREAYGNASSWPEDAPLNATFWHGVTEAMEADKSLVETFNTYQGKSSIRSPNCTSDACAEAKVCYMRSGSVALGKACPQGFASVQSPYTGKNF